MRLLDLFCGAGGASMGYHLAGFDEVVGVDNRPMPRYPFHFIQADALEFLNRGYYWRADNGKNYGLNDFDVIHASPPCQAYSRTRHLHANSYERLIDKTRMALEKTGKPYIIENVVLAPLRNPFILCGKSFGLNVRRHRLFETNFFVLTPPCQCKHTDYYVIFGHEARPRSIGKRSRAYNLTAAKAAMGIDWMVRDELAEAVPPAYTEFIGGNLLKMLERQP
jgi:DNA (cytosine-5)-methyltransferase 1